MTLDCVRVTADLLDMLIPLASKNQNVALSSITSRALFNIHVLRLVRSADFSFLGFLIMSSAEWIFE